MRNQTENIKVLIADDSVILNNIMKDVFEEFGFQVVQAFDGLESKTMFLKERPDVTFVDVIMPKVSGVDVLRFIKQKAPESIVVMMTGAGSEETALQSMKLGADEYLTKPFETEQVVNLTRNLLERRRADKEHLRLMKEIRSVEKYLANVTTIIDEGLITTDRNGKIEFINLAATKLWGYSLDQLKGKDVHLLIRGEADTLLDRDLVKDTIRYGTIKGEFHFRKKDKGSFIGYLSTSVIEEKDRVRGIVLVVTDLTRLREMESRLKQSEKLASLGKVVEGVAHEVRNCLTSLGGFTIRLRKMTADNPQGLEYTRIMLDDVARLEKMVREIEEYVRFSKFYTFQFSEVDPIKLVYIGHQKALTKLSSKLAESVVFNVQADHDLPQINADPKAIEEVFYNIILNAYEAMPAGGKLTVQVRRIGSVVSVVFTDTGIGIHDQELGEIFNPFFTSKTSGAGMGLSKVYLLVEEHGGTTNVRSEPGKGSSFEVQLPLERLSTGTQAWRATSRGGDG
jgi:two-component system cell cycle sensor histidine kinase/response regulator CckA